MDERRRASVEVRGRSVEAATADALEQLGLPREQVEVEIIRRGSRGLLGLLSEDAVVRVTVKGPPAALPPEPPEVSGEAVWADQEAGSAVSDDEVAGLGTQILSNLMGHMGLRATVSREALPHESVASTEEVRLNIAGEGLGVLIGRRGETLRSLQYLTCLLISRKIQRWPSLAVDVEDYKARREKTLTELARRMADRVRATRESVPLEPMPAYERRIVHLALRDDPDVFTESYGQDEKRKVVILPKT